LDYPRFFDDPYPALEHAYTVDLERNTYRESDYTKSDNPPILHRKETFVTTTYPRYEEFAKLTQQEEELGLLKVKSDIGTREGWEKCLAAHKVEIKGHQVYPIQES